VLALVASGLLGIPTKDQLHPCPLADMSIGLTLAFTGAGA
jgi:hypothetical protein